MLAVSNFNSFPGFRAAEREPDIAYNVSCFSVPANGREKSDLNARMMIAQQSLYYTFYPMSNQNKLSFCQRQSTGAVCKMQGSVFLIKLIILRTLGCEVMQMSNKQGKRAQNLSEEVTNSEPFSEKMEENTAFKNQNPNLGHNARKEALGPNAKR